MQDTLSLISRLIKQRVIHIVIRCQAACRGEFFKLQVELNFYGGNLVLLEMDSDNGTTYQQFVFSTFNPPERFYVRRAVLTSLSYCSIFRQRHADCKLSRAIALSQPLGKSYDRVENSIRSTSNRKANGWE